GAPGDLLALSRRAGGAAGRAVAAGPLGAARAGVRADARQSATWQSAISHSALRTPHSAIRAGMVAASAGMGAGRGSAVVPGRVGGARESGRALRRERLAGADRLDATVGGRRHGPRT